MFRRNLPVFAIVLMQVAAAAARADEADEYIKGEMQKQRIPGLSAAVVRRGEVIKAKGYGLASVELNVAASPETVYKIGSISKQFLATGIMLLAGEGRLGLKDPISKYLDGTPGSWKDITIWHLLTHTSGLVREAPGFNPLKIQSDAEVIKTAYPLPLRFQPGEKWEYCNLGYFTLAEIIRKVSGKAWSEFLDERVFKPLGMNATRTTSMKDIILNRADAYFWEGNKLLNAEDLIALRPSGAFVSTVRDLAKWDAALYGDTILTASARERMWQPAAQTDRKSDDGTKVIEKMKATPTDDPLFGKGTIRVDGRKIHPAYLVEVKKPAESKKPWDYYKIRATIPADQAFRPLDQGGCELVKK